MYILINLSLEIFKKKISTNKFMKLVRDVFDDSHNGKH